MTDPSARDRVLAAHVRRVIERAFDRLVLVRRGR